MMMGDEEIAEPKVSKLVFIWVMNVGTMVDIMSRRVRTSKVVLSRRVSVLIMRG